MFICCKNAQLAIYCSKSFVIVNKRWRNFTAKIYARMDFSLPTIN